MSETQNQNLTKGTATPTDMSNELNIEKLTMFRLLCDRLSTWHKNPFALQYEDDKRFFDGFLHLISSQGNGVSACTFLSFLAEREIKNLQAKNNG